MSAITALIQSFKELGIDQQSINELMTHGFCQLETEDKVLCQVVYNDADNTVFLISPIFLNQKISLGLLKKIMALNLQYNITKGACLGVNERANNIELVYGLSENQIQSMNLTFVINNFVSTAKEIIQVTQQYTQDENSLPSHLSTRPSTYSMRFDTQQYQ